MPTKVEILLFEGFDELDAVGPYEVLDSGAQRGADLAVSLVTLEPTEIIEASHGMRVVPAGELSQPDVLVVPGGGWTTASGVRRIVEAGEVPRAVAERHATGTTVASVCTGAMVLAAAGLLDGRPATTHHAAHRDLEAVTERIEARVVDDGTILTAGGVTAGLDLGLHLLKRSFGGELAATVARNLEYEPSGPVHVTDD